MARRAAKKKSVRSETSNKRSAGDEWELLEAKHPGHRHLSLEQLLTLPMPVVNAIAKRLPTFFSPEDLAFEKDLARTARLGFFHRSLIEGGGLITPPYFHEFGTPDEHRSATSQSGRATFEAKRPGSLAPELYEEWSQETAMTLAMFEGRPAPRTDAQSDRTWREERSALREEERRRFRQRCEGFVVWLASNQEYLDELNQLRLKYEELVKAERGFPRRRPVRRAVPSGHAPPHGFITEKSPSFERKFGDDAVVVFDEFYKKWSLNTLLTWDLPLPHNFDADLTWEPIDGEGFQVFIPWHLLRDGIIDLNEVFKRYRRDYCPKQLFPWLETRDTRSPDHGGEFALSRKFQLYWCIYLVLAERYPDRVGGKLEALDQVFAPLLGDRVKEETVRKLRLSLGKELRVARNQESTSSTEMRLGDDGTIRNTNEPIVMYPLDKFDAAPSPPPLRGRRSKAKGHGT
jgi:hypothetical protein